MEKNRLKRIVMIGGIMGISVISLITTSLLSENGNVGIYGKFIVWFNTISILLWILVSNWIINLRYKQKDV
jgi:hypothetical protein